MKYYIEKGSRAKLSQRGHNGFFYPSSEDVEVLYSLNADKLPWVGSSTMVAVSVPKNAVSISGSASDTTVIWI